MPKPSFPGYNVMTVQLCVGSSCHLKGSETILHLLQAAFAEHGLEQRVTLAGSFCTGLCNRDGVTISVDGQAFPGITPENFQAFFTQHILKEVE